MKYLSVGIIGGGTMGRGIAYTAALNKCRTTLYEISPHVLESAKEEIYGIIGRQKDKGRFSETDARNLKERITFTCEMADLSKSDLVIEAVVEEISVKKNVFSEVEKILLKNAIIATNTSSLSITSIASAAKDPKRVVGMHFFNPAYLMPLVEIIPGLASSAEAVEKAREAAHSWNKITVIAKDTPGFIVNRIARPFYGEALRMLEEGAADAATIDWAMKVIGGFRMGPFELMDLIGNDVNYKVTESVFEGFYYDARYRPSITQKRLVEAGRLGRKTGHGFYDYSPGAKNREPVKDIELAREIWFRIISMLINEAADALHKNIASKEDIELAMMKGVNYPLGLFKWADEIGLEKVFNRLRELQQEYGEERYRPSVLLRKMVKNKEQFYP
ncbi:MAG: 3-hydroxyacyl-CoA dehydrogenase NAD-binding domain-containing protein [Bacteroidota bacterium]|nr:3-hydroxybutyryl-CoA dehydrogenase [Ignavibacteria bacterium]MCU7500368.1 3-hydroxybutyryl-CoA dehydrogenase [Ignavibacteria bacterium]MCU7513514.1 3-hydroxybutyryl-CoA dehydrogenase [Ignavibacteria bacterium]MCU7520160.1 3-hydroxybutyryl-CoA dehydrogenase [Ignavibacteria bacterium]MCU7526070.1 3-hydroxybutyryl-CoA dehydrogenase [Ignavibacteria bacterium]